MNGLNILENGIKGAYNYSGLPKLFGSMNFVKAIREEKRARRAESERLEMIYNEMKKAGFVKPQKKQRKRI